MNFFAKKELPLLDVSLTSDERNKWTPDAAALEEHAFQLFFSCERFQPDFPEHDKMVAEHVVYAGIGYTNEKFVMQKSRLGRDTYPVIQRKDYNLTPPSRIKGHLFYIQSEEFRNLDSVMRNGVEFQRELIEIHFPYANLMKLPSLEMGGRHKAEYAEVFGTEHPSVTIQKFIIIKAYCYIGIDGYWDDLITPYQWSNVRRYQARREDIGEYYYFSKRELFDHD